MKFSKKGLYEVTWRNIAPPYPDYEYFKDCTIVPFRYDSDTYEPENAWWLVEAATLSYAEKDFAETHFRKAGFTNVEYISVENTQCYVVSNEDFTFVVFRGTESRRREGEKDFREIIDDITTDADIRLVDSGRKGRVHKGFKDGLDHVWDRVTACVRNSAAEGGKLWITGHSLGVALATIAAYRFQDVQGLYVFGSPRVGDREFRDDFDVPSFRFENNNDIVCRVPPSGIYQHVGELRYIDSDGRIHNDPSKWERLMDGMKGKIENTLNSLRHIDKGLRSLVPDELKDHVPVLYAIHIWNNLVESMKPDQH
jgi:triacylglycerol lipase